MTIFESDFDSRVLRADEQARFVALGPNADGGEYVIQALLRGGPHGQNLSQNRAVCTFTRSCDKRSSVRQTHKSIRFVSSIFLDYFCSLLHKPRKPHLPAVD
jgi:hypothetical protein